MGFDMMMTWETAYNKETGKPYHTSPPEVPAEYREFLVRDGWFWANFVPTDNEGTTMSADAILENYAVKWDEIDWDNCFHEVDEDDREEYKEEYEAWRTALKWFADNHFTATWWW